MLRIFKATTAKEVTMLIFSIILLCLNILSVENSRLCPDITACYRRGGESKKEYFAWNFDVAKDT